jgi:hypothetical protein
MACIVAHNLIEFIWLLDWRVLGGFDTEVNRRDPFPTYREAFGQKREGFDDRLRYWIDDTVGKIIPKRLEYDFASFVSFRDAWAAGGASVRGKPKKVVFSFPGRRDVKSRLNDKWYALAHCTDEQILNRCMDKSIVLVRPFVKKDEAAACRTVQSYDTYSIIRCSYLEQAIGSLGDWTSIGYSVAQRVAMRRRFMVTKGWKVCTDQSSFDTHQKKEWVVYAMRKLVERLGFSNHPDLKLVGEHELLSMERVYLEMQSGLMKWENGVLSGHKFTALLDSILNRAETRTVYERLGYEIRAEVYQGDDSAAILSEEPSGEDMACEFGRLGLEVNPEKTWIHRERFEYLHELYVGGNVYGFPARAMRALLWRKPSMGGLEPVGTGAVLSYLDVHRMAARRGLRVLESLRAFVRSWNLLDDRKFTSWVQTPSLWGGFGLGARGRTGLEVSTLNLAKWRVYISGLESAPSVIRDAAFGRLNSTLPVPGYGVKLRFVNVKGSVTMERLPFRNVGTVDREIVGPDTRRKGVYPMAKFEDMVILRSDWVLEDVVTDPDAYRRKLILEQKLRSGDEIDFEDTPTGFRWPEGTYRAYRRWLEDGDALVSAQVAVDSYVHAADWAKVMWKRMCTYAVMRRAFGGMDKWRSVLRKSLIWKACETYMLAPLDVYV